MPKCPLCGTKLDVIKGTASVLKNIQKEDRVYLCFKLGCSFEKLINKKGR